ncbi:MAG: hypothetical protein WDN49_21030 [Acetobacteraceae bacterium]
MVQAAKWQRGSLTVPRSAFTPIAAALRAALPDVADLVDSQTAALTSKDEDAIGAIGAALWPQAAAALGRLGLPADWAATGLSKADYTAIAGAIEAVLHVAPKIHALAAAGQPVTDDSIRRVLGRTVPRGQEALSVVVAVLLARLPAPERVIALAAEANGASPPRAADRAVEHALDSLQASVDGRAVTSHGDTAQAALQAARVASLLAGLEASASTRPDRKRRIEQIRRDVDSLCRRSFDAAQPGASVRSF